MCEVCNEYSVISNLLRMRIFYYLICRYGVLSIVDDRRETGSVSGVRLRLSPRSPGVPSVIWFRLLPDYSSGSAEIVRGVYSGRGF